MSIFIVIIDESNQEVEELLDKHYSDNYRYHENDRVFFVRTKHIADKIARNLKIKTDDDKSLVNGVVLKLNSSYSGFTSRAIWDWLDKEDE